jgi:hypothetical protein
LRRQLAHGDVRVIPETLNDRVGERGIVRRALAREIGDARLVVFIESRLAWVAFDESDFAESSALRAEALRLARKVGATMNSRHKLPGNGEPKISPAVLAAGLIYFR